MSITAELQATARSTYRALMRSAAVTFSGDDRVHGAFRAKIRDEMIKGRSVADAAQYESNVRHWQEVAEVLRKNFVQAERVESEVGEEDVWRLRITKETELGLNDTVKEGSSSKTNSRQTTKERRLESVTNENTKRQNFNVLKRLAKQRKLPDLREEDLEESFVRGSGPGGQSINKTQNNVQLLHKPSGIRVSCQETRSLQRNREIARKILIDKLDQIQNPGLSKTEMALAKKQERGRQRRKKARKKQREKDENPGTEDETTIVGDGDEGKTAEASHEENTSRHAV